MKKRDIFIAIIVIMFGLAYQAYEDGKFEFSFYEGCSFDRKMLVDKQYPNDFPCEEIVKSNIGKLQLDNAAGNIVVETAPAGETQIRIQPLVRVYSRDKSNASEIAKDIKVTANSEPWKGFDTTSPAEPVTPSVESSNTPATTSSTTSSTTASEDTSATVKDSTPTATQTLVPNGSELLKVESFGATNEKFPYHRVRVIIKVIVPRNVELEFKNYLGDISVKDYDAPITINERYGDIDIASTTGKLNITHRYGNVTVSDSLNSLNLETHYSRIDLKTMLSLSLDCAYSRGIIDTVKKDTVLTDARYSKFTIQSANNVSIDGKHSELSLKNITGGLNIRNSYENIYMENIEGNILVKASDCKIDIQKAISDNIIIEDAYDNIRLYGITAKRVDIVQRKGKLELDFDRIDDALNIKSSYSKIYLSLPKELKALFNVEVYNGKISNQTKTDLVVVEERNRVSMTSEEATGKPQIIINNSYGDVYLDNNSVNMNTVPETTTKTTTTTTTTPEPKAEKEIEKEI